MRLKLGTRRSALALAQSGQVKARLEALHPGLTVDLVGMDTEGDHITGPLQESGGKDFFVKELDTALLAGRTDFSVHSYKDLSLDRPPELIIAAVPERENPRDIALFHPAIREKLAAGAEIAIGSASPRRARNTPSLLSSVLPTAQVRGAERRRERSDGGASPPSIKMHSLRGNVTTRVKKLAEGEFDGIILALAGLNRLGADISAFPRMILPLDACPTAPAQGALAIECRADDAPTREILATLHHAPTAAHIARERDVLRRYGGGCHQAFGATSIDLAPGIPVTFVRGLSDAGETLDHLEWAAPHYTGTITAWDGTAHRKESQTSPIPNPQSPIPHNVFITHHRAAISGLESKRLWTSGVMSWRKLAERGYWVEGCAENLGFDHIAPMLGDVSDWAILTHEAASDAWRVASSVATYKVIPSPQEADGIESATHVYWGSGSQFLRLRRQAVNATHHACGTGKTAEVLRSYGITPDIFPSRNEWKKAVSL